MAKSNLLLNAFVCICMGKCLNNLVFIEPIEVYELKVGTYSPTGKYLIVFGWYQWSSSLYDLCPRSL